MNTNNLVNETSPYLLQHAHNPVEWYPWSEEALHRAVQEDKPILVSIGYAACHWCHVMEKESFEDKATATFMNDHFINIKIDREERPDLDHIYMNAVQVMTGSGGWPLNVFLTPGKKPFYGGTYYPPFPAYNRPSWMQVLQTVADAFQNKRQDIESQSEDLTYHLLKSQESGITRPGTTGFLKLNSSEIEKTFQNIMQTADTEWGGFGNAPKFLQTFTISFLFRYYHFTGVRAALDQALLSLNCMIRGGIYDQLEGGISRYSTDREWLVPHFEKMLYDNALFISTLTEAYQITGEKLYADTVRKTFDFLLGKMLSSENGFCSAIDADSEGEEGKYYIWSKKEVDEALGEESNLFCKYYNVTSDGNWEGNNILHILKPAGIFAASHQIDIHHFENLLYCWQSKLYTIRERRKLPHMDDKIILGWNALMNTACSKAYAALGDEQYRKLAIKNMDFLMNVFCGNKNCSEMFHTYKSKQPRYPAFLDDYAFLIQALIHLQEITGNQDYLQTAKSLAEYVETNFSDNEHRFFFYTHSNQKDVIVRTKEVYDGATPSGNSIMAWNLYYLSTVFDINKWKKRSIEMVEAIQSMAIKYPASFGMWACCMTDHFYGINELAVVGDNYKKVTTSVLKHYIPNKVIQSSAGNNIGFPLLSNRFKDRSTLIYRCREYSCQKPIENANEFIQLIEKEREDKKGKAQ
ncbi:MAG: thioredoxin domain-containing protein [Bacteroidetes bacterium]|nr:thioredoxin domain-containing protein [Bacteroidota bacterium]